VPVDAVTVGVTTAVDELEDVTAEVVRLLEGARLDVLVEVAAVN